MTKYDDTQRRGLYRVSITAQHTYKGKFPPVYVVQDSKQAAYEYVTDHLRNGAVDKIAFLADEMGMCMFIKTERRNT